jgi:PBSX family phage terminase large subunit
MSSWGVIDGPPFRSILESDARLNIWTGPVRSAKTVHSLIRWLEYAATAPQGALLMIGKTEDTLERNILAPMQEATDGAFTYSKGKHRAYLYGREIYLIGANDERAEQKIRGMTAAGAYGDEVTLWPESFFSQLLARLSLPGAKLFGTTNPDSPYHWLKANFLDRENELDLKSFGWPLELNTYLDPAYIAALKSEYTGLWYKRFILGEWVSAEGAVFDFFNESLHVGEVPLAGDYIDLACDYGTSNATAVGLIRSRAGMGLKAWLERTYYYDGRLNRQRTDAEHADAIDREFADVKARHRYFILDPSAASFKAELRKRGWFVKDANNDVLEGIRIVAKMMKAGNFKLGDHASNRVAIKQLSGYAWDTRAQKRGEDKPLKQDDHAVDMIRYALATLYPALGSEGQAHSLSAW